MQNFNTTPVAQRYVTQEIAQIEAYGQNGKIIAKMSNLSSTGAFFEILTANSPLKPGTLARFTVKLKSLNKVHVIDCEVVWAQGRSLGVKFLKRDALQDKLVEYFAIKAG